MDLRYKRIYLRASDRYSINKNIPIYVCLKYNLPYAILRGLNFYYFNFKEVDYSEIINRENGIKILKHYGLEI